MENLRKSANINQIRRTSALIKKAEIDTQDQKKKIFEVVK